jgi:hypothetical protein
LAPVFLVGQKSLLTDSKLHSIFVSGCGERELWKGAMKAIVFSGSPHMEKGGTALILKPFRFTALNSKQQFAFLVETGPTPGPDAQHFLPSGIAIIGIDPWG